MPNSTYLALCKVKWQPWLWKNVAQPFTRPDVHRGVMLEIFLGGGPDLRSRNLVMCVLVVVANTDIEYRTDIEIFSNTDTNTTSVLPRPLIERALVLLLYRLVCLVLLPDCHAIKREGRNQWFHKDAAFDFL